MMLFTQNENLGVLWNSEKRNSILDLNIEQINPNDSDYKLIEKNRTNGEKVINIQGDSYRLKEKESNINSDIYKFGAKSSTKIVEKSTGGLSFK